MGAGGGMSSGKALHCGNPALEPGRRARLTHGDIIPDLAQVGAKLAAEVGGGHDGCAEGVGRLAVRSVRRWRCRCPRRLTWGREVVQHNRRECNGHKGRWQAVRGWSCAGWRGLSLLHRGGGQAASHPPFWVLNSCVCSAPLSAHLKGKPHAHTHKVQVDIALHG